MLSKIILLKSIKKANFYIFYLCPFFLVQILGCNENAPKFKSCDEEFTYFTDRLKNSKIKNDTIAVIAELEEITFHPKSCVSLQVLLAATYHDIHDFYNSKQLYKKILSVDKKNVYSLVNLSLIFYYENAYDSAIALLNEAIDYKTSNGFVIDDYDKLNSISQSFDIPSVRIRYYLGLNYYYKTNYEEALLNFDYCISKSYNLKEAFLYRGSIYYETDKTQEACADFVNAKKLGNTNAGIYIQKYCNSPSTSIKPSP